MFGEGEGMNGKIGQGFGKSVTGKHNDDLMSIIQGKGKPITPDFAAGAQLGPAPGGKIGGPGAGATFGPPTHGMFGKGGEGRSA